MGELGGPARSPVTLEVDTGQKDAMLKRVKKQWIGQAYTTQFWDLGRALGSLLGLQAVQIRF
jgi:hypothetical protein